MLNLHPPFRFAENGAVEAEEDGRVVAALAGAPSGGTWTVRRLELDPGRRDEFGPRILAVADALAADEGLGSVTLDLGSLDEAMREMLDREGFRLGEGGHLLVRPVIPQG